MTHWKAFFFFFLNFVSKQTLDNRAFVILIPVSFEFLMSATDFQLGGKCSTFTSLKPFLFQLMYVIVWFFFTEGKIQQYVLLLLIPRESSWNLGTIKSLNAC